MARNSKQTGKAAAKAASKVLHNDEIQAKLAQPFSVLLGKTPTDPWAQPQKDKEGKDATGDHHVEGDTLAQNVEAMERCGNGRPRVERLVSAWNQGTDGDIDPVGEPTDSLSSGTLR